MTSDAVPVVHHDGQVGGYAIAATEHTRLAAVRLPNGERLPTLAQALATIGENQLVFIEVKALRAEHDDALFAALDAGPAPSNYHVHSFDHRIVKRLRTTRPSLPCGVLSASYLVAPLSQLTETGAWELWQEESLVDVPLAESVHGAGARLYAWTVDDPERMQTLLEFGVDAICTNKPDVAREVLG
jgi:glycerophosphoryl diester phosphodiesterase